MSEHPARKPLAPTSSMTDSRSIFVLSHRDTCASPWQIENVTDKGAFRDARRHILARHFALALDEQIDVVWRQRIVEWRLDRQSGPDRLHDMRRNDDHKIGF